MGLGAHAVLLLDGAGWHQQGERLPVPENISLLPLPAYSPELNPVENIWEFLRGNYLSHRVWDRYEAILEACREAWNKLMQMPERLAYEAPLGQTGHRMGRLVLY
jgi:transposase